MGTALITIKIMPTSPDVKLDELQKEAEAIIQEHEGEKPSTKIEPVAFGLNSVNISFSRDENLDNDEMLEKINNLENTSSAEITDFRRAFG
jgi:translation elongation factor aEF-1 beta